MATSVPAAATISTTSGRPSVRVPVLSNTTVSIRCATSSASPPLMRMPASAPRPVPTMIAVGVARPIAHGHATITVAIALVRARVSRGSGPTSSHATNVTTPRMSTSGTKTSLIRSARRWIGAFEPCARWTSSTMRARAVSRPTRVARITKEPVVLRVAPMTSSAGPFVAGMASPVSIDSSTAELPSTTRPSTGTRSPGRTRRRSPGWTRSSGTSSSPPGSTSHADVAWSPTSRRIAPVASPFARASSQRPSRTSPMTMAALSKYVAVSSPASRKTCGQSVATTL